MDSCRGFLEKIRNPSIDHLENASFIIGWIRLCCRLVILVLSIIVQLGTIDDRPNMFGYMFTISLTSYCIFSICINIMYLYGIKKAKPTMILMFVTVEGFEVISMTVYIIFGSSLSKFVGFNYTFWCYLPFFLVLLGASLVSFIYSFLLHKAYHKKLYEQTI